MSLLLPWRTVEPVGTCQKAGGGGGFAETTRTQEKWEGGNDRAHMIESEGRFCMAGRPGSCFEGPFVSQTNGVAVSGRIYFSNLKIDAVVWFLCVEKYGKVLGGKWGPAFGGSVFCLGTVRQPHEAVAVESPGAEAEPAVVFRTSLLLTPTL